MSSGMPELGSKISLISKADIRYEGRLFTVDPQECTIALASVRSFGTEDRETQFPVAPQAQVYDYILFRGSDIKDIRVLNNVPSLPNDPAIMQMSVPPSLGGSGGTAQFPVGQYNHPVVGGGSGYPPYHPMAGFAGTVHPPLNKTSELSPQHELGAAGPPHSAAPAPPSAAAAPIGTAMPHHNQVKDQGSMLDLIGGGSAASRSGTPGLPLRKSPTADQGTQVGTTSSAGGSGQRESRRGSAPGAGHKQPPHQQQQQQHQQQQAANRNRPNSRNRQQRYPSQGTSSAGGRGPPGPPLPPQTHPHPHPHPHAHQHHNAMPHHQPGQGYMNRGGWRGGRSRGRGRGYVPRNKNTLKFENDYDFEQANTEFEELRSQLAKTKISDEHNKNEGEVDKKDDSGNETGAGEPEPEEEGGGFHGYDKSKSFFDNISCEAVERSKGRSQRTDWRTERKLNSETFGVAMARRGAWRGRPGWRQHDPHHQWRQGALRGVPRPREPMPRPREPMPPPPPLSRPRTGPPPPAAPPAPAPAASSTTTQPATAAAK